MAGDADTGPAAPPPGLLDRVVTALAIAGGALALGVAILVTVSVGRRWFGFQPIPGDFEFVQMATAVSIFSFLPYCQLRHGNIAVDTFTPANFGPSGSANVVVPCDDASHTITITPRSDAGLGEPESEDVSAS